MHEAQEIRHVLRVTRRERSLRRNREPREEFPVCRQWHMIGNSNKERVRGREEGEKMRDMACSENRKSMCNIQVQHVPRENPAEREREREKSERVERG